MLYQTQSEINTFYCGVVQRVASSSKVGIADWDMKSKVELLQEIQLVAPTIFSLLKIFLQAYQDWYDMHVQIDTTGTAGNLTPSQSQSLNDAIARRDRTRSQLLAAV